MLRRKQAKDLSGGVGGCGFAGLRLGYYTGKGISGLRPESLRASRVGIKKRHSGSTRKNLKGMASLAIEFVHTLSTTVTHDPASPEPGTL